MELRCIAFREGNHLEVDVYTWWGHMGVCTLGLLDAPGPGLVPLFSLLVIIDVFHLS